MSGHQRHCQQHLILPTRVSLVLYPARLELEIAEGVFLAGNIISGPIPPAISSLSNLTNDLTGTTPTLSSSTNQCVLDLTANQLRGTIPDLSRMTALRNVTVALNDISGSFPEFAQEAPLAQLRLSFTNIAGTLPSNSKHEGRNRNPRT